MPCGSAHLRRQILMTLALFTGGWHIKRLLHWIGLVQYLTVVAFVILSVRLSITLWVGGGSAVGRATVEGKSWLLVTHLLRFFIN